MKKLMHVFLSLLMLLSFTGCGHSIKDDVVISESPAVTLANKMVDYQDANGCFTAKVPQGWNVATCGYDMYYWIRIFDPSNPDLQVFTLLKTECLLMNQNTKKFYEDRRSLSLYTMFADMIVAENVEDFYSQFMDFCAFMGMYEPTYAGFEYPQINDFEVIDKYALNSNFLSVAIDDALIHANYMDNWTGTKCDGMFSGSLVNGFNAGGIGCNMMYNINAITAPYGLLNEYEPLLNSILSSINYTDTFVSTVQTDLSIKAAGAAALNQTLQQTSDIITSGWAARQETYDIASQKYSDATLGYERVYDVETGDIYKANNGFMDTEGIDKYFMQATDEMYTQPISGYINN